MNPRAVVSAFVSLIILLLLIDMFFCGCLLIEDPILGIIAEALGSTLAIQVGDPMEEGT